MHGQPSVKIITLISYMHTQRYACADVLPENTLA